MYMSLSRRSVDIADLCRKCARLTSTFIMLCWFVLFAAEAVRSGVIKMDFVTSGQAIALAVVFSGYVLGWWKELVGGLMAIAGTIGFIEFLKITQGAPDPPAVWFALPGILYLMASVYTSPQSATVVERQP